MRLTKRKWARLIGQSRDSYEMSSHPLGRQEGLGKLLQIVELLPADWRSGFAGRSCGERICANGLHS
jgi:hypothetical protein